MPPGRLPAVDDRLVDPEMNVEIIDGEVFPVSPAREPHGERHSKLSSLLEACVAEDFNVAVDMLTRTDVTSDFAPDASVYPRARDPQTGGRQLEHLAFEVVSTQTMAHAGRKARSLRVRGVRRVFAIDVKRERVLEWSTELDQWDELLLDDHVEDEVLAVPLSLRELVTCASTCDAVARMLLARNNAVLAEHDRRTTEDTLRQSITTVLTARGLPISDTQRRRLDDTAELEVLQRWVGEAATCEHASDLLGDPSSP